MLGSPLRSSGGEVFFLAGGKRQLAEEQGSGDFSALVPFLCHAGTMDQDLWVLASMPLFLCPLEPCSPQASEVASGHPSNIAVPGCRAVLGCVLLGLGWT